MTYKTSRVAYKYVCTLQKKIYIYNIFVTSFVLVRGAYSDILSCIIKPNADVLSGMFCCVLNSIRMRIGPVYTVSF